MSRPPLPPLGPPDRGHMEQPQPRMVRRIGSINDLAIAEADRLFHWPQGRRPDDHPGLSDLGL